MLDVIFSGTFNSVFRQRTQLFTGHTGTSRLNSVQFVVVESESFHVYTSMSVV